MNIIYVYWCWRWVWWQNHLWSPTTLSSWTKFEIVILSFVFVLILLASNYLQTKRLSLNEAFHIVLLKTYEYWKTQDQVSDIFQTLDNFVKVNNNKSCFYGNDIFVETEIRHWNVKMMYEENCSEEVNFKYILINTVSLKKWNKSLFDTNNTIKQIYWWESNIQRIFLIQR